MNVMDEILKSYGLAGLVIAVLASVVVFLYRDSKALQRKYDAMQELRLQDARETRDKLMEPLENQARMSEKIYDLLLNGKRGR